MPSGDNWSKPRKVVWLEPHGIQTGGQYHPLEPTSFEADVARALSGLPQTPMMWIVDDLWAPAILLNDIVEIPSEVEAKENFLRWRYAQNMGLEDPQYVQALEVEASSWLLLGMPESRRDAWLQTALKLRRPIHALIPRWLWLYNRMAPTLTAPGMMLSLCPERDGMRFTGTLVAWGQTLTLLRQWGEPASAETWMEERVYPTAAFMQRETRSPRELIIWGAHEWPESFLPIRILARDIPLQEAI